MTSTLTPRERELARHALGLDGVEKTNMLSGFAFVNRTNKDDLAAWRRMVRNGNAEFFSQELHTFGFRLTRSGALAALEPGEALDDEDFPR